MTNVPLSFRVNIHFFRHGYSCGNADRDYSLQTKIKRHFKKDPALTEGNEERIREYIEHYLADQNVKFDKVYTSPLKRAYETGDIIKRKLHDMMLLTNTDGSETVHRTRYLKELDKYTWPKIIGATRENIPTKQGESCVDKKEDANLDKDQKDVLKDYNNFLNNCFRKICYKKEIKNEEDEKENYERNIIFVTHKNVGIALYKKLTERDKIVFTRYPNAKTQNIPNSENGCVMFQIGFNVNVQNNRLFDFRNFSMHIPFINQYYKLKFTHNTDKKEAKKHLKSLVASCNKKRKSARKRNTPKP